MNAETQQASWKMRKPVGIPTGFLAERGGFEDFSKSVDVEKSRKERRPSSSVSRSVSSITFISYIFVYEGIISR